jgi:hypothetical protein
MKKLENKFEWTEEANAAFAQLKKVLSTPPVLVAPKEREPLLLYIAATHQVVSTVSWFLRHVCNEGYLKAIERGDRRSGARDGDRQGLPRFTSPR